MNTNVKGDIGMTQVVADLTKKGYDCFIPISNASLVDLIVLLKDGRLKKLQVKYLSLVNGNLKLPLRTVSCNGRKIFSDSIDQSLIDGFAIFCSELNQVLYVPVSQTVNSKAWFYIRCREGGYTTSHHLQDFENFDAV